MSRGRKRTPGGNPAKKLKPPEEIETPDELITALVDVADKAVDRMFDQLRKSGADPKLLAHFVQAVRAQAAIEVMDMDFTDPAVQHLSPQQLVFGHLVDDMGASLDALAHGLPEPGDDDNEEDDASEQ